MPLTGTASIQFCFRISCTRLLNVDSLDSSRNPGRDMSSLPRHHERWVANLKMNGQCGDTVTLSPVAFEDRLPAGGKVWILLATQVKPPVGLDRNALNFRMKLRQECTT